MPYKVLIVDDSAFVRHILARMLSTDDRFEVVGEASNGIEAIELSKIKRPDVITLDIQMPVMDGLTALRQLVQQNRRVVIVSAFVEDGSQMAMDALNFGAVECVPKENNGRTLLKSADILREKLYAAASVGIESKVRESKAPGRPIDLLKKKLNRARLVVIGSSTGGPRALQDVLPALSSLPVPVVVAQHMPGSFTASMVSRLDSLCSGPVIAGEHGQQLMPGHIYIAPGGMLSRVKESSRGALQLDVCADRKEVYTYCPSVDVLAHSAADNLGGESVLAVMLTGMGYDGALGFKKIKEGGGYVIAQNEDSCVVYGMPKAVASMADDILPLSDIAGRVAGLLV